MKRKRTLKLLSMTMSEPAVELARHVKGAASDLDLPKKENGFPAVFEPKLDKIGTLLSPDCDGEVFGRPVSMLGFGVAQISLAFLSFPISNFITVFLLGSV